MLGYCQVFVIMYFKCFSLWFNYFVYVFLRLISAYVLSCVYFWLSCFEAYVQQKTDMFAQSQPYSKLDNQNLQFPQQYSKPDNTNLQRNQAYNVQGCDSFLFSQLYNKPVQDKVTNQCSAVTKTTETPQKTSRAIRGSPNNSDYRYSTYSFCTSNWNP